MTKADSDAFQVGITDNCTWWCRRHNRGSITGSLTADLCFCYVDVEKFRLLRRDLPLAFTVVAESVSPALNLRRRWRGQLEAMDLFVDDKEIMHWKSRPAIISSYTKQPHFSFRQDGPYLDWVQSGQNQSSKAWWLCRLGWGEEEWRQKYQECYRLQALGARKRKTSWMRSAPLHLQLLVERNRQQQKASRDHGSFLVQMWRRLQKFGRGAWAGGRRRHQQKDGHRVGRSFLERAKRSKCWQLRVNGLS